MCEFKPNEEIGAEIHENHDQFFRFEQGNGKVMINETVYNVGADDVVIVPAEPIIMLLIVER